MGAQVLKQLLGAHAALALAAVALAVAREPALVSVRNALFVYALAAVAPLFSLPVLPAGFAVVAALLAGAVAAVQKLESWRLFAALFGLTLCWQLYGVYALVAVTGGA